MAFDNPFAGEIWSSKYRFAPAGGGGDASLTETWARVARAVSEPEAPDFREVGHPRVTCEVLSRPAPWPQGLGGGGVTGGACAARKLVVSTSTRRPERNDSIDARASSRARRPAWA